MRASTFFRRAIAPLLLVCAIVVLFLPLTPAYDLNVFLRAGHAVLHGLQVYPDPGSKAVYSGSSFVYPYFAVWPFVPLAAISTSAATTVFFILSTALVLAAAFVAAEGDPWRASLVLGTAFTITGLQLGALSPLLFAGAAFLWQLRDRPAAFALLAAVVIASKLFLAPLLVWVLLARRWRAFAWASAATAVLLLAGFAFGPLGLAPYAHLLSALGAHEAYQGFGLIGVLQGAGVSLTLSHVIAAVLAVALVAASYFRYRRRQDEAVLFCGAIVASLILTPVLWSHYLVLLAAALLALRAPRRWFMVLAGASWVIAPPHGFGAEVRLVEGASSLGPWLAVGGALVVFVVSLIRRPAPSPLQ